MVILESGAAVAAAGMAPGTAAKVYGYNRDNFMEDREQRMKKEFHERKYRVIQGQLWRQDVRDFISLTEQKMSLYLIVNVLLLSFTVTMWVEGQLPETTPDWLVIGYQIASVVAFSYLVLTIWLAMHAAVAAQSYQTRILTQLVRLPIPTWKELEAARTAASEFEKIESRQMFRVPFVTASQEGFIPGHTADPATGVSTAASVVETTGNTGGTDQQVERNVATDPWGLEQRGDNIYELNTYSGAEVAELRHIKLLRQAAVYWQTYDAFARVSMSVGINQLMLGMSYYILGYAMLEVKAPCAALGGVLLFMGSSEVVARVDLTLPTGQQRFLQVLVGVGPVFSFFAAYIWAFHREETNLAELLAPLAYISNGIAVGIMTVFVRVEEQENGAMLPRAFKSVLFLDVFGWVSQKGSDEAIIQRHHSPPDSQALVMASRDRHVAKPAASAVQYDEYRNSLPARAADTLPGLNEDMRYLQGAPRAWETVSVSAGKVMPSCQDTGTAIAMVKRGTHVLTDGRDEEFISRGVYKAYSEGYLRYSQVAPLSMFEEANTKTNLPAQIDMLSQHGNTYDVLYIAKGGGSANKTQLLQKTKGVLNEKAFMDFVTEQVQNIGTAACPPYHLALVVGGLSAEQNLKTVKLASCKYLDGLPTSGNKLGRAFRDVEWEEKIRRLSQELGIGAQFGGKYFLHDVRVVRLPRHGASCPVGIGVSCSADRQAKAKITEEGVFLEKLETDPAKYLPDITEKSLEKGGEIVKVDLNKPMEENLKFLSQFPVSTRLALTGTIIVARDIAHAKMQEMLDSGKGLPDYIKQYPVYFAGPAKTPAGMPSGSFGPTTSGRMDQYVDTFQSQRGSMIMIGKGNRSKDVTNACKKHGGFYLGSIGGVAATLSANSIKKVEVLDMEELGMEAVWRIEVEDFPAFVVVDNKGNDFFKKWSKEAAKEPETDSFFDEAKNFFHGLDKDQNGKLDVKEIMAGLSINQEKAERLVQQFDVDKDGVIDVKEFELMLLKNEALREQLHQD